MTTTNMWDVYFKDIHIGVAYTETRFALIKESADKGIIPHDYNMTDITFKLIG